MAGAPALGGPSDEGRNHMQSEAISAPALGAWTKCAGPSDEGRNHMQSHAISAPALGAWTKCASAQPLAAAAPSRPQRRCREARARPLAPACDEGGHQHALRGNQRGFVPSEVIRGHQRSLAHFGEVLVHRRSDEARELMGMRDGPTGATRRETGLKHCASACHDGALGWRFIEAKVRK